MTLIIAARRSWPVAGFLTAALVATGAVAGPTVPAGDAEAGRKVFVRSCRVCHQVEAGGNNSMGPSLAGMAGKKALVDAGYKGYSPAFTEAAGKGLAWDAANLDRFLAAPAKAVPGTKMPVGTPDATHRRNLIAYLMTLKD